MHSFTIIILRRSPLLLHTVHMCVKVSVGPMLIYKCVCLFCAQKLATLFFLTLFGTVLSPRASAQPAPAPPPAPRVAVCFVGGLRTFLLPGVYTSQSSYLLGALRAAGAETETYLYLELPAERSQAGIQPEARQDSCRPCPLFARAERPRMQSQRGLRPQPGARRPADSAPHSQDRVLTPCSVSPTHPLRFSALRVCATVALRRRSVRWRRSRTWRCRAAWTAPPSTSGSQGAGGAARRRRWWRTWRPRGRRPSPRKSPSCR